MILYIMAVRITALNATNVVTNSRCANRNGALRGEVDEGLTRSHSSASIVSRECGWSRSARKQAAPLPLRIISQAATQPSGSRPGTDGGKFFTAPNPVASTALQSANQPKNGSD